MCVLFVPDTPLVTAVRKSVSVIRGDVATLTCNVVSQPLPNVSFDLYPENWKFVTYQMK